MASRRPTILVVPLEIRWRIYDFLQSRDRTWYTQLRDQVTIRDTGPYSANIIALSKACPQFYHEVKKYYCSKKRMDININRCHDPRIPCYEHTVDGARINHQRLSCLTNVRSLELNLFIGVTEDQVFETQLIENIAAAIVKSDGLLRVDVNVRLQVSRRVDGSGQLVTKLKMEMCKLRMKASRKSKQFGKKAKDCQAEFCMEAINLIKDWDYQGYEGED